MRSRVRAPDHFRGRLRGGRPSRRSALHARCAVVASPASLTRASRSALGRALARGARASQPVAHALRRLCRSHTPPPLPSRSARRDARLRPPPICTATLRSAVRSAALTAVRLSSSRRPASGPGSAPYHRWGALASPPWRRAAGRAAAPSAAAAAARRAVLGARLGARSGGGARSHARCTACMPETICGRAQSCRRRWCTGRGAATAPWRGCSRCPCAAHARLGGRATPSPLVPQPRAPVTTRLSGGGERSRVCAAGPLSRAPAGLPPPPSLYLSGHCAAVASPAADESVAPNARQGACPGRGPPAGPALPLCGAFARRRRCRLTPRNVPPGLARRRHALQRCGGLQCYPPRWQHAPLVPAPGDWT